MRVVGNMEGGSGREVIAGRLDRKKSRKGRRVLRRATHLDE